MKGVFESLACRAGVVELETLSLAYCRYSVHRQERTWEAPSFEAPPELHANPLLGK